MSVDSPVGWARFEQRVPAGIHVTFERNGRTYLGEVTKVVSTSRIVARERVPEYALEVTSFNGQERNFVLASNVTVLKREYEEAS